MKQIDKNVSAMSNKERNSTVIHLITKALLKLLEEKALDDISISELCRLAGVGRASFYRNFESKEDVLKKHLQLLWNEWGKDLDDCDGFTDFLASVLRYFYKHRELDLLLYRHGMSRLLYEMIRWGAKIDESESNMERYAKSTAAGVVFGMIDEWMRQGMKESPEEIWALFKNSANLSRGLACDLCGKSAETDSSRSRNVRLSCNRKGQDR